MIAIFSPAEDSPAVDSRRLLQFMTTTLVAIGYPTGSAHPRCEQQARTPNCDICKRALPRPSQSTTMGTAMACGSTTAADSCADRCPGACARDRSPETCVETSRSAPGSCTDQLPPNLRDNDEYQNIVEVQHPGRHSAIFWKLDFGLSHLISRSTQPENISQQTGDWNQGPTATGKGGRLK
jgi:hypothetical protein